MLRGKNNKAILSPRQTKDVAAKEATNGKRKRNKGNQNATNADYLK